MFNLEFVNVDPAGLQREPAKTLELSESDILAKSELYFIGETPIYKVIVLSTKFRIYVALSESDVLKMVGDLEGSTLMATVVEQFLSPAEALESLQKIAI